MTPDVSVVVVTYNARAYVGRCLDALAASSFRPIETLLIDNASTDGTARYVAEAYPAVRLLASPTNDGFGAASNAGIRGSRGEYVLLLNPDAVLAPGSLGTLVDYLEANRDVGIAGCRLLNDDGSLQHSIGKFPTVANQVGRILLLHRLFPWVPAFRELEQRPGRYAGTHDVEWLFGAVMLVRREAFEEVGLFDEDFFLFSEEEDWCLRMEQGGWRVAYVAETSVTHIGRGGVGAPEVYVHLLHSKHAFIAKHHGAVPAALERLLMFVGLSVRYAGTALQGLAGASASSRRRCKAFASGIRWTLFERGAQ